MLILLGLLQLIACIGLLVWEFNKRSVAIFFWGMLTIVFSFPHFIVSLAGNYSCKESSIATASLFVILFSGFYWLTRSVTLKPKNIADCDSLSLGVNTEEGIKKLDFVVTFFVLAFVVWLLAFSKSSLGGLGNTSWGQFYRATSSLGFSPLFLAPYLFACSGGAVINSVRSKRKLQSFLLIACCLIYLFKLNNLIDF